MQISGSIWNCARALQAEFFKLIYYSGVLYDIYSNVLGQRCICGLAASQDSHTIGECKLLESLDCTLFSQMGQITL